MDASPDAVGEEKIMDAPLAASSSSQVLQGFPTPSPAPLFPMSTDIIGQRNTRRLAMDFLVKLKSPSLFLFFALFLAYITSFSVSFVPIQSVKMFHRQRWLVLAVS